MVTVDTVKKSWKNAVLAKYTTNYWLTYDRSGKYAANFKCLHRKGSRLLTFIDSK